MWQTTHSPLGSSRRPDIPLCLPKNDNSGLGQGLNPNNLQGQSAFRSVIRTALITEGDGSSPLQASALEKMEKCTLQWPPKGLLCIPVTILVFMGWKAGIYPVKRAAPCRWPMLPDLPLQVPRPPLSHSESPTRWAWAASCNHPPGMITLSSFEKETWWKGGG